SFTPSRVSGSLGGLLSMARRPPSSPRFPYTTLFRSLGGVEGRIGAEGFRGRLQPLLFGRGIGAQGVLDARAELAQDAVGNVGRIDRKSTRLNSSHVKISYAVFCLKKKTINRSGAVGL